jgi:hypothetical protein
LISVGVMWSTMTSVAFFSPQAFVKTPSNQRS